MNGKLIVLDGLDGSGKHTQCELLAGRLKAEGLAVRAVSFPDYGQPSSALVKMYLAGEFGQADEVGPYAASSFYAVDRYASFQKFWKQDYLSGHTILADRYATSNLIHQMSKLPQSEWESFHDWMEDFEYGKLGLPKPDLVLYLDMHPDVSRRLLEERYGGDGSRKDIHESNLAYLLRCRTCAHFAAQAFGWKLIACSDAKVPFGVEEIAQQVYAAVGAILTKQEG